MKGQLTKNQPLPDCALFFEMPERSHLDPATFSKLVAIAYDAFYNAYSGVKLICVPRMMEVPTTHILLEQGYDIQWLTLEQFKQIHEKPEIAILCSP